MPHTLRMADSTDASRVPELFDAYAGYVDGHWRSYPDLRARFPRPTPILSITTLGGDAMCVDCERGDVTLADAAHWIAQRLPATVRQRSPFLAIRTSRTPPINRPCIYIQVALIAEFQAELSRLVGDVPRETYRVWGAHWTSTQPSTPPAGCDAIQWRSCPGPGYDLSVITPEFITPQMTQ